MPEPTATFSEFVRERKFLKNVTPRTLSWYEQSWKSWQKHGGDPKSFVINLREAGVSAIAVNSYARALNAYFNWAGLPKIPKLKEEQKVLPVLGSNDTSKIVFYKPRKFSERKYYLLCITLLDTGLRINEALQLRWNDVDWENLLLTVNGKGNKQRRVPFSFELRKALWKFRGASDSDGLVFSTKNGTRLTHRNVYRSVHTFLVRLGIQPPARMIHAFRHTFAINYLRAGGSVFHLQKVLGHSSLAMTRRYANLMTEDLQAVHEKLSLLSRLG